MKTRQKLLSVILSVCILMVLALPAFAVSSDKDANACETLGLIKGEGNGVTDSYLSQKATRLQAAILLLRLYGLEEEAKNFIETDNFIDVGELNDTNKAIFAFLKDNPKLGFVGYNNNIDPLSPIREQEFYKVLLTALGYSQGTDFMYSQTVEFAEKSGLTKLAQKGDALTVGDLCTGVTEALVLSTKNSSQTLIGSMVDKHIISLEAAQKSGLYTPVILKPIDVYIPDIAAQPNISTVSYTAHKLTVKLDCSTSGATIYYEYSVGGTAAAPTSSSPNHVSAGSNIEIDDTNVGDTINIKAIAMRSGFENSAVSSYTRNGYIIEAITDSSVATLSGHTITLTSTAGATTVVTLLSALQVSSGASVQVYETSGCMVGEEVNSGNICAGYTLRVSSGYNADDLNDYSFVLATARSLTASADSGIPSYAFFLTLTSPSGGDIYYTLDGSDPTTSVTRTLYTAAIHISVDTTIKAIAVVPGMQPSAVLEREYTFA